MIAGRLMLTRTISSHYRRLDPLMVRASAHPLEVNILHAPDMQGFKPVLQIASGKR